MWINILFNIYLYLAKIENWVKRISLNSYRTIIIVYTQLIFVLPFFYFVLDFYHILITRHMYLTPSNSYAGCCCFFILDFFFFFKNKTFFFRLNWHSEIGHAPSIYDLLLNPLQHPKKYSVQLLLHNYRHQILARDKNSLI